MIPKKKILINFGQRVQTLRKEKNLTQDELAFRANMHRTYIGMIERAEKNISLINIDKLASALEVDIDLLLKDISNENTKV